jgi:hypothetical protein
LVQILDLPFLILIKYNDVGSARIIFEVKTIIITTVIKLLIFSFSLPINHIENVAMASKKGTSEQLG